MTQDANAHDPYLDEQCSMSGSGRYKPCRTLGRGSFGEVLEAVDRLTGDRVALKRIFISQPEAGLPCNVFREYKCLQRVEHDNVVRILDVYPREQGQHVVLALELCATDLHSVITDIVGVFPPSVAKRLMRDLLRGLAAVHDAGVIHRDIKPSNLMLDERGDLKIADFGLARPAAASGAAYSLTAPSQSYRAPELLFGCREYDGAAVDVWSAACVLAELLGQTPLFKADSELEQLACIIGVRGTYDPEAWGGAAGLPDFHKIRFAPSPGQPLAALLPRASPGAVALLERCLTYDPAQRPSAAEALQSEYFGEEPATASDAELRRFLALHVESSRVQESTFAAW